jgi:hypothetical protein
MPIYDDDCDIPIPWSQFCEFFCAEDSWHTIHTWVHSNFSLLNNVKYQPGESFLINTDDGFSTPVISNLPPGRYWLENQFDYGKISSIEVFNVNTNQLISKFNYPSKFEMDYSDHFIRPPDKFSITKVSDIQIRIKGSMFISTKLSMHGSFFIDYYNELKDVNKRNVIGKIREDFLRKFEVVPYIILSKENIEKKKPASCVGVEVYYGATYYFITYRYIKAVADLGE